MRNPTLHEALQQFTVDAGQRLTLAASAGDEIPFEVAKTGGPVALYCYRPLTGEFIRTRLGLLTALPSYASAARALEGIGGGELYLRARGERPVAEGGRALADAVVRSFLARVFEERSEFSPDPERFRAAYEELERALYQGRCVTELIAPLYGLDLDLDSEELALGDGLSIVRPRALGGAPPHLLEPGAPALVLVLRIAHDSSELPPTTFAQVRFRRVLTALRLYERGGYGIAQLGYRRLDDGEWAPIPLGAGGRPRLLTLVARGAQDELRAFCNLVARRLPSLAVTERSGAGEVGWALARFEMGAERTSPFETLTDHLLALRALLEPEGPASGRLAGRLAAICATPEERVRFAQRTAEAIALERAVICGLTPDSTDAEELIDELGEHLRAILRDVLCGHLNADVRAVADELLEQAATDTTVADQPAAALAMEPTVADQPAAALVTEPTVADALATEPTAGDEQPEQATVEFTVG